MKNKCVLLPLMSLFFAWHTNAQIPIYKQPYKPLKEFKGDAQQYLIYNFIDAKDNFIGKDLFSLLGRLELKTIDDYVPMFRSPSSISGIDLYFENTGKNPEGENAPKKTIAIRIIFKSLVSTDSVFKLVKKNKKQWTCNERKFYGSKVIADIIL